MNQDAHLEDECGKAGSFQHSRLASLPLTGLQVEFVCSPASTELVGGVFFDVFPIEHNKTAMVVGDVSGKGLLAASRCFEIKHSLRAYLRELPHPAAAMMRLNDFLCEVREVGVESQPCLLNLSVVLLSTTTRRVSIATAGMEPPIILRSQSNHVDIGHRGANGIPIGVMARAGYGSANFFLHAGDTLAIATNGITEARPVGGEFFGIHGVVDMMSRCRESDGIVLIGEAILAQTTVHAGGALNEDACILLARRL